MGIWVGNCVRTFLCKIFSKSVYSSKLHSLNFVIILKHQFFFLRSAFAKFRCGVAPLRIETGRYENKNVNERVCFICHDQIEDEKHVIN
jgi:hypothetical protein